MNQKRKSSDNHENNDSPPLKSSKKVFKSEDDVNNLEDALNFLKQIFPYELFQNKLPCIIWKHQLYALISDRTNVDKDLHQLIEKKVLRSFAMGSTMGKNELALCFADEYKNLVNKILTGPLFLKFWSMLERNSDCKFAKDDLIETYGLNESNIKELVSLGVISLHQSVGFYILSIPSCGDYSKKFEDGRKAILNIIKKNKFKEILKPNLMTRKLPFEVKLPILYHILDLIGSNRVEGISSPTGLILRYK